MQEDLTQPRRDILKYIFSKDIPPNIVDNVWTVDGDICLRPTQHTSPKWRRWLQFCGSAGARTIDSSIQSFLEISG